MDTYFIGGRFDVVIEFDDGSCGVIDYKTGNPESEYAIENPMPSSLRLSLFCFKLLMV